MPLFLETYTIPSDLPQEDIVRAMRKVDRGTDVRMLRCGYNLTAGKAWAVTEARDEAQIRRSFETIEFPFTLDQVAPAESATMIDAMAQPDGVFEPSRTRPADVGSGVGDTA